MSIDERIETVKTLAALDETTLKKAMKEVKASDKAKARAIKEINDYKYVRNEIAKIFSK